MEVEWSWRGGDRDQGIYVQVEWSWNEGGIEIEGWNAGKERDKEIGDEGNKGDLEGHREVEGRQRWRGIWR